MLFVFGNKGKGMQSSSEQPLVGEERYVTTLITAAKETSLRLVQTKKKRKSRFYSTKNSSNNNFDLFWKKHCNAKTCKLEEISNVVHMLWLKNVADLSS